jgi:hypothetical protein
MIGDMKPIKLIKYSQSVDANGDASESVATTYKMWAYVKTFKVYFRDYNINSNYKIEYFGQTYAISNAKRVDERRFNWELTAFNMFELD